MDTAPQKWGVSYGREALARGQMLAFNSRGG